MVVLLGGDGGFTRPQGLRRIKERLETVPGASRVRYEPSAIRPRTVVADIDVELFLGRSIARSEGRLEVLWRPRKGVDIQRVQWSDGAVSLGWHKDGDHPELGTTHFQLESRTETRHEPAYIEVEAPVSFLELCLERLPDRLDETISR